MKERRGSGRELCQPLGAVEEDDGNLGCQKKVLQVGVGDAQLADLPAQLSVCGLQLQVCRPELFLGSLQFLAGRLELLVGGDEIHNGGG